MINSEELEENTRNVAKNWFDLDEAEIEYDSSKRELGMV